MVALTTSPLRCIYPEVEPVQRWGQACVLTYLRKGKGTGTFLIGAPAARATLKCVDAILRATGADDGCLAI